MSFNVENYKKAVVHFYTARSFHNKTYKLLCTKEHVRDNPHLPYFQFATSARNVTCKDCLDILIAKREKELNELRATATSLQNGVSEAQV